MAQDPAPGKVPGEVPAMEKKRSEYTVILLWKGPHRRFEDNIFPTMPIATESAEGALCEKILHTKGVVTCICIDQMNGCIAAGVQDAIRVYDPESLLQVQCNTGHTDLIRSLIHIPEIKQYVTVSWDRTVRIWKAYHKVNNQNNSIA